MDQNIQIFGDICPVCMVSDTDTNPNHFYSFRDFPHVHGLALSKLLYNSRFMREIEICLHCCVLLWFGSVKIKGCYDANFVITAGIGGCYKLVSWQHLVFSVVTDLTHKLHITLKLFPITLQGQALTEIIWLSNTCRGYPGYRDNHLYDRGWIGGDWFTHMASKEERQLIMRFHHDVSLIHLLDPGVEFLRYGVCQ